MSVVDYLLDGLEAELELERELGVRVVECDRALLEGTQDSKPVRLVAPVETSGAPGGAGTQDSKPVRLVAPVETSGAPVPSTPPLLHSSTPPLLHHSFIFLHHEPLSAGGVEMMAKIIRAMGQTAETAPVIVAPPVPKAKIAVVLGGKALKAYFPEMSGAPGQWRKTNDGMQVLITYSPEYILRFVREAAAVDKIKREMWTALKGVVQRLKNEEGR